MFNFDWSELALIGVVALVLIGPKDMPVAIRAVSESLKKMRRMAGDLQGHVDDMVRDADLGEARDTFRDLRSMNIRGQVMRTIDADGALRRTLAEKPLAAEGNILARRPGGPPSAGGPAFTPGAPGMGAARELSLSELGAMNGATQMPRPTGITGPGKAGVGATASHSPRPAFVPPSTRRPPSARGARATAPAFIPPGLSRPPTAEPASATPGDADMDGA